MSNEQVTQMERILRFAPTGHDSRAVCHDSDEGWRVELDIDGWRTVFAPKGDMLTTMLLCIEFVYNYDRKPESVDSPHSDSVVCG